MTEEPESPEEFGPDVVHAESTTHDTAERTSGVYAESPRSLAAEPLQSGVSLPGVGHVFYPHAASLHPERIGGLTGSDSTVRNSVFGNIIKTFNPQRAIPEKRAGKATGKFQLSVHGAPIVFGPDSTSTDTTVDVGTGNAQYLSDPGALKDHLAGLPHTVMSIGDLATPVTDIARSVHHVAAAHANNLRAQAETKDDQAAVDQSTHDDELPTRRNNFLLGSTHPNTVGWNFISEGSQWARGLKQEVKLVNSGLDEDEHILDVVGSLGPPTPSADSTNQAPTHNVTNTSMALVPRGVSAMKVYRDAAEADYREYHKDRKGTKPNDVLVMERMRNSLNRGELISYKIENGQVFRVFNSPELTAEQKEPMYPGAIAVSSSSSSLQKTGGVLFPSDISGNKRLLELSKVLDANTSRDEDGRTILSAYLDKVKQIAKEKISINEELMDPTVNLGTIYRPAAGEQDEARISRETGSVGSEGGSDPSGVSLAREMQRLQNKDNRTKEENDRLIRLQRELIGNGYTDKQAGEAAALQQSRRAMEAGNVIRDQLAPATFRQASVDDEFLKILKLFGEKPVKSEKEKRKETETTERSASIAMDKILTAQLSAAKPNAKGTLVLQNIGLGNMVRISGGFSNPILGESAAKRGMVIIPSSKTLMATFLEKKNESNSQTMSVEELLQESQDKAKPKALIPLVEVLAAAQGLSGKRATVATRIMGVLDASVRASVNRHQKKTAQKNIDQASFFRCQEQFRSTASFDIGKALIEKIGGSFFSDEKKRILGNNFIEILKLSNRLQSESDEDAKANIKDSIDVFSKRQEGIIAEELSANPKKSESYQEAIKNSKIVTSLDMLQKGIDWTNSDHQSLAADITFDALEKIGKTDQFPGQITALGTENPEKISIIPSSIAELADDASIAAANPLWGMLLPEGVKDSSVVDKDFAQQFLSSTNDLSQQGATVQRDLSAQEFGERTDKTVALITEELNKQSINSIKTPEEIKEYWAKRTDLQTAIRLFLERGNNLIIGQLQRKIEEETDEAKKQELEKFKGYLETMTGLSRMFATGTADADPIHPDKIATFIPVKADLAKIYAPGRGLEIPMDVVSYLLADATTVINAQQEPRSILSSGALSSIKDASDKQAAIEIGQKPPDAIDRVGEVTHEQIKEIVDTCRKDNITPIGQSSLAYPHALRLGADRFRTLVPTIYAYGSPDLVSSQNALHLISESISGTQPRWGVPSTLGDVAESIKSVRRAMSAEDSETEDRLTPKTREQHMMAHVSQWMTKFAGMSTQQAFRDVLATLNEGAQDPLSMDDDFTTPDGHRKFLKALQSHCQKNNIYIVTPADNNYPDQLRNSTSPWASNHQTSYVPSMLFVKGKRWLSMISRIFNTDDFKKTVACVSVGAGKSQGSHVGALNEKAKEIIDSLSDSFTIVTSLSGGTNDAILNAAKESNKKTITVIPFGFGADTTQFQDPMFKDCQERLNQAAESGIIVTEHFPGMRLHKEPYEPGKTTRNQIQEHQRLIAGLSCATIILSASAEDRWIRQNASDHGIDPRDSDRLKFIDSIPMGIARDALSQRKRVLVYDPQQLSENTDFEQAVLAGQLSGNFQLMHSNTAGVSVFEDGDLGAQMETIFANPAQKQRKSTTTARTLDNILTVAQMSKPDNMDVETFTEILQDRLLRIHNDRHDMSKKWLKEMASVKNKDGSPVTVILHAPDSNNATLQNVLIAKEVGAHITVIPSKAVFSRTQMPDEYDENLVLKKINSLADWSPLNINTEGKLISLVFGNETLSFSTPEVAYNVAILHNVLSRDENANSESIMDKIKKISMMLPSDSMRTIRQITPKKPDLIASSQKIAYMYSILRQKFSDPSFQAVLLHTGNADIVHASNGEDFWGVANESSSNGNVQTGLGQNMLGKLLVHIRKILKQSPKTGNVTLSSFPPALSDKEIETMIDDNKKRDESISWHKALGLMGLSEDDITVASHSDHEAGINPNGTRLAPNTQRSMRIAITGSRDIGSGGLSREMVEEALRSSVTEPSSTVLSSAPGTSITSSFLSRHNIRLTRHLSGIKSSDVEFSPLEIIHGGAKGVDTICDEFFREKLDEYKKDDENFSITTIPYDELSADAKKDKDFSDVTAGHRRNTKIVSQCDVLVAIWDGKSPGTLDAIMKAIRLQKKILLWTPGEDGKLRLQKILPAKKGTVSLVSPFVPVTHADSPIAKYHASSPYDAQIASRLFAENLRTASMVLGMHYDSPYSRGILTDSRRIGFEKPIVVLGRSQSDTHDDKGTELLMRDQKRGYFPADERIASGLIYKGSYDYRNQHSIEDPSSWEGLGRRSNDASALSDPIGRTAMQRTLQRDLDQAQLAGVAAQGRGGGALAFDVGKWQTAIGLGIISGIKPVIDSIDSAKQSIFEIEQRIEKEKANPDGSDPSTLDMLEKLKSQLESQINGGIQLVDMGNHGAGVTHLGHTLVRQVPTVFGAVRGGNPSSRIIGDSMIVANDTIPHLYATVRIASQPGEARNTVAAKVHVFISYRRDESEKPHIVSSMVYDLPDSPPISGMSAPITEVAGETTSQRGTWWDGYGNYRIVLKKLGLELAKDLLAGHHAVSIIQDVGAITAGRQTTGVPLHVAPQSSAMTNLARRAREKESIFIHAMDDQTTVMSPTLGTSQARDSDKDIVDVGKNRKITKENIVSYIAKLRNLFKWPPETKSRVTDAERASTRMGNFDPRHQWRDDRRDSDGSLSPIMQILANAGGETKDLSKTTAKEDAYRAAFGVSPAAMAAASMFSRGGVFAPTVNNVVATTTQSLFAPNNASIMGQQKQRSSGGFRPYNINIIALLGGSSFWVFNNSGGRQSTGNPKTTVDSFNPEVAYCRDMILNPNGIFNGLFSAFSDNDTRNRGLMAAVGTSPMAIQQWARTNSYSDAQLCNDIEIFLLLNPGINSTEKKKIEAVRDELLQNHLGAKKHIDDLDYGRPVDPSGLLMGKGSPLSVPTRWGLFKDSLFFMARAPRFAASLKNAGSLSSSAFRAALMTSDRASGLALLRSMSQSGSKSLASITGLDKETCEKIEKYFSSVTPREFQKSMIDIPNRFLFLRTVAGQGAGEEGQVEQLDQRKPNAFVRTLRVALGMSDRGDQKILTQLGYMCSAFDVMHSMDVDFRVKNKYRPVSTLAAISEPLGNMGATNFVMVPGSVWQATTLPVSSMYKDNQIVAPSDQMNVLANVIVCSKEEEINRIFLGLTAGSNEDTQKAALTHILTEKQKASKGFPSHEDTREHYVFIGCPLGADISEGVVHFDEAKSSAYKDTVAIAIAHAANIRGAIRSANGQIHLSSDEENFKTLQSANEDAFNAIAEKILKIAPGSLATDTESRARQVRALVWAALYVDGVYKIKESESQEEEKHGSPTLVLGPKDDSAIRKILREVVKKDTSDDMEWGHVNSRVRGDMSVYEFGGGQSLQEESPRAVATKVTRPAASESSERLPADPVPALVAKIRALRQNVMGPLTYFDPKTKRELETNLRKLREVVLTTREGVQATYQEKYDALASHDRKVSLTSAKRQSIIDSTEYLNTVEQDLGSWPSKTDGKVAEHLALLPDGAFSVDLRNIDERIKQSTEFIQEASRILKEYAIAKKNDRSTENSMPDKHLMSDSFKELIETPLRIPGEFEDGKEERFSFADYPSSEDPEGNLSPDSEADWSKKEPGSYRENYIRFLRELLRKEESCLEKMKYVTSNEVATIRQQLMEATSEDTKAVSERNEFVSRLSEDESYVLGLPEKMALSSVSTQDRIDMSSSEYDQLTKTATDLKHRIDDKTQKKLIFSNEDIDMILMQQSPKDTSGKDILNANDRGIMFSQAAPILAYFKTLLGSALPSARVSYLKDMAQFGFDVNMPTVEQELVAAKNELHAEEKNGLGWTRKMQAITEKVKEKTDAYNLAKELITFGPMMADTFEKLYTEASDAYNTLKDNKKLTEYGWSTTKKRFASLAFWKKHFLFEAGKTKSSQIDGRILVTDAFGGAKPINGYTWSSADEHIPLTPSTFIDWIREKSAELPAGTSLLDQITSDKKAIDASLSQMNKGFSGNSFSITYPKDGLLLRKGRPQLEKPRKRTGFFLATYDKITYRT